MLLPMEEDGTLDAGSFDDLTIRFAWLYYQHALTQERIARRFRVSRTTVARVIRRVRREGLVEFRFAPGPECLMLLEEKLCRQYALEEVILVPFTSSETALRTSVAKAMAAVLERSLEDGMVVGLGASRSGPNCPILQMANCKSKTVADLQVRGAVGEIIARFYDIEGKATLRFG